MLLLSRYSGQSLLFFSYDENNSPRSLGDITAFASSEGDTLLTLEVEGTTGLETLHLRSMEMTSISDELGVEGEARIAVSRKDSRGAYHLALDLPEEVRVVRKELVDRDGWDAIHSISLQQLGRGVASA